MPAFQVQQAFSGGIGPQGLVSTYSNASQSWQLCQMVSHRVVKLPGPDRLGHTGAQCCTAGRREGAVSLGPVGLRAADSGAAAPIRRSIR